MAHQAPSRGVLDGIKNDVKKAKEGGDGYNPNGVGNAYSHNFLNQKPWHPANFRNQAKVYEAQQAKIQEAKQKEIAKAEFQAEQEYLQTLSFLSPEEQQKYKERQGVQFLYMKPPGADSMPAAPIAKKPEEEANQAAPERQGGAQPQAPIPPQHRLSEGRSHVGNMLGAVRALKNHEKWEVKHLAGMGSSPQRGAAQSGNNNQTFLASSSEGSEGNDASEPTEEQQRQRRNDRLAEAEAVLRRAGIDVEAVRRAERKKRRKDKKHREKKRKKRRKEG